MLLSRVIFMKRLLLAVFLLGCLHPLLAQTTPSPAPTSQSNYPELSIDTGAPVMSVDYSPDGKRIITGGQSHDISVWDAVTGERIATLKGHTDDVIAVRYSANGRYIASGGIDNSLILWDAISGDLLRRFTDHTDYVRDVAFSPDGRLIASASWDGRSMVWETFSGQKVATLDGHHDNVTSVTFNPKGTELLTSGGDQAIRAWDTKTWLPKYVLKGHTDDVWDANYSPNGRYVAGGAWDNTARVWDVETRQLIYTFPAHVSDTWSVVFSPNGQLIATGGGDNKVKIWDMATGLLVADLSGMLHTAEVEKVVFRPDGESVASVSRDGTLKVWRVPKADKRIDVCTVDAMQKWAVRGEFEKTDEYRKRMAKRDRQTELTSTDCRERILNKFSNTVDWTTFTVGAYDADNETYKLQSSLFGDQYRIKVPPRDALQVRANFAKLNFGVPAFDIEANNIVLRKVDVTIPLGESQKTYTIYR
jgi:WD40 repeat protein